MDITITWGARPSGSEAEALERVLKEDAANHPFFQPCHDGPASFQLDCTGYLLDHVKGVVACSCGARIGGLDGTISGSSINFWRTMP